MSYALKNIFVSLLVLIGKGGKKSLVDKSDLDLLIPFDDHLATLSDIFCHLDSLHFVFAGLFLQIGLTKTRRTITLTFFRGLTAKS